MRQVLLHWARQMHDYPEDMSPASAAVQLTRFFNELIAHELIEGSSLGTATARMLRDRSEQAAAASAVRRSLEPVGPAYRFFDDDLQLSELADLTDPGWEAADGELVRRAVDVGSPDTRRAAVEAIYEHHHRRVLAYCEGKLKDLDAAQDAASETFLEAWKFLATLREPNKLGSWLIAIARCQCRRVWREGDREIPVPELVPEVGEDDDSVESEADAYDRASKARQAEVDRLLDTVVATFTDRQRNLFQLTVRQGLRGSRLAAALHITAKEASRDTYNIISVASQGFGALVLARGGRRYCPDLDRILTEAAKTGAWDGQNFTPGDMTLRQRIVRHLAAASNCDNCSACNALLPRLMTDYAP